MDFPPLMVIRGTEFEEQLAAIFGDNIEEADDFTAGAEFLLSLHPRAGLPVDAQGAIWYLPMATIRGRQVSLYYSFDERAVYFIFVVMND